MMLCTRLRLSPGRGLSATTCLTGIGAALLAGLPGAAIAQTATVPAPAGLGGAAAAPAEQQPASSSHVQAAARQSGDGDIVVTGSRIQGNFSAPTPLTAVSAAQLQEKAVTSVAELMTNVPQLRINQNIGKSSEPVGQSVADLRGLGFARTLVLFDGRRLAATSLFGGIDTNIFPISLLSGVEITTGGASAAYGSDAVAGVINFQINKNLEGLKADVSYGESKYGDFRRPVVSAALGKSFFDDRLHIEIAGDYYRNSGQTRQASRPWGSHQTTLLNNPGYKPGNGQYKNYIADGAVFSTMTGGGLITGCPAPFTNATCPVRGIQFTGIGQTAPFTYGSPVGAIYMIGGSGESMADDGNLLPLIVRYSSYGRADFEATSNLKLWGDILYSKVKVFSDLAPNYDIGTLSIRPDNAFLPSNVRSIMTVNNLQSFKFGRINYEEGPARNNSRSRALRYAVGAEATLGGWKVDASAQWSRNTFYQEAQNNRVQSRWFNGVDSVISPVTGQPICRINLVTVTDPNCVAINVFGRGAISQAARDYYIGTSFYASRQHQDVYAVNASGSPFATWAGDVGLAFGAEYRKESIHSVADPISIASGWRSINQKPISGGLNVKEVYGEVQVPLARSSVIGESLDLNGAVRYTDYSTSGGVVTWKAGLVYSPVEGVRLRGTLSRDIRAANVNELFSGQNQVINAINDPRTNTSRFVTQLTGGNPNLTPEKASTKVVGIVLQPKFLPGFSASLDYYDIKIRDAIATIPPQTIVNNCFAGQTAFCSLLSYDANAINLIQATLINTARVQESGLDIEASYRRPVTAFGREFRLGFRGIANYVAHLKTTTSGVTVDNVENIGNTDNGGVPHWRANFDFTAETGPVRAGFFIRYIGGGKYNTLYVDGVDLPPGQNDLKGRTYFDASLSYKLTDNIEIYGTVDNIFNKAPPISPNSIVQPTISNSQFFDRVGRFFVGGVRVKI